MERQRSLAIGILALRRALAERGVDAARAGRARRPCARATFRMPWPGRRHLRRRSDDAGPRSAPDRSRGHHPDLDGRHRGRRASTTRTRCSSRPCTTRSTTSSRARRSAAEAPAERQLAPADSSAADSAPTARLGWKAGAEQRTRTITAPHPKEPPRARREPHPSRSPGARRVPRRGVVCRRARPDHGRRDVPLDDDRAIHGGRRNHDVHRRDHRDGAQRHAERRSARPERGERRPPHPARRPRRQQNELIVVADFAYTNTGEGLHRFVDPVDQEVYLYTQFEVPDSRRVFAVFEQPDLKATFQFTVTAPVDWVVVSNSPTPEPVDAGGRGRRHLDVRADAAHLELHHRARRRPVPVGALRAHELERPRHPARHLRAQVALPVPRRRLHLRHHPQGVRVLRGEVRLPVPVRQVRPAVRARVQRGRHGERRRRHLHRDLRVPLEGDRRDQGAPGRHDPARARAHVVRRPGHDALVERPVAERVVRRVGVDDRDRRGHRVDRGVGDVPVDGEELGLPAGSAAVAPTRSSPRSTTSKTCRSTSTASPTPRAGRC